jgi:hypothetical protein
MKEMLTVVLLSCYKRLLTFIEAVNFNALFRMRDMLFGIGVYTIVILE